MFKSVFFGIFLSIFVLFIKIINQCEFFVVVSAYVIACSMIELFFRIYHHKNKFKIAIKLIYFIDYLTKNQMAVERSLRAFAIIAIIMEIFFAIIYGFHEGYVKDVQYADFNGLLVAVFLVMLLLVGKLSVI